MIPYPDTKSEAKFASAQLNAAGHPYAILKTGLSVADGLTSETIYAGRKLLNITVVKKNKTNATIKTVTFLLLNALLNIGSINSVLLHNG